MERMEHQRILILTGRYGEGHRQAALALQEAYGQSYPNASVQVVDYMEWMHPYTHELGRTLFVKGVAALPSVYGFLFEQTRRPGMIARGMHFLTRFGIPRMQQLLEETRPTLVVSTFPLAAGAMSALKQRGLTDVPTVTVITDHTDHSYWVHPYTDRYLVGSERVGRLLRRKGVPSTRITVTGIPIRSRFGHDPERELLRHKHGLRADMPTILLMGGGCGIIDKHLLAALESEAVTQRLQLVICCGHNTRRMEQMTRASRSSRHRIVPLGFVECIDEYMALADLIVTKPGGLSTSEAIAMRLPMLLYRALPGQEEDNARYLTKAGVAVRAEGELDLARKLSALLEAPEQLDEMRNRASRLDQRHSAGKAALQMAFVQADPYTAPSDTGAIAIAWSRRGSKLLPEFLKQKWASVRAARPFSRIG
ncbi:MGDG synthase family glycosyltransferase [Paenibacillus sp. HJGM_3]|uniref:MGDG synthase family glycosyltransferase n=1 Tax=Paenibacillus sp. HJGM_3 TaxID=3379816 RepID=UPI00385A32AA